MKRIYYLLLLCVCVLTATAQTQTGNWNVIPLPQSVELQDKAGFNLSASTSIVCRDHSEEVQRTAHFLQTYIHEISGINVKMKKHGVRNVIEFVLNKEVTNPEGYRLVVSKHKITIMASTPKGLFYGVQTFGKALPIVKDVKAVVMPAVVINDYPRFAYRGFLVDVGRHFFSVSYLKEIIDLLALHDINYFHWHLTEDQGWRIEIKKYPRLTKIGSHRSGTVIARGSNEVDSVPVDGYYTQEQAREIVKYAADRFITVIPEIDLPGHSLAALASYPQLGCTGGPYEIPKRFGVFDDVLCGGKASTLQFAKDVLNEIMDIFPSPYIHIGGDECPKTRWRECPDCQAKIKELGLKDVPGHSKEDQLQAYMMGELEKLIHARGRKTMGWDEILAGNAPKSTVVMAWTSYKAAKEAARLGYKTIVCPITNFYFSNPWWNKITGVKSLDRVYNLPIVPKDLSIQAKSNIVGAEGCIWTEWTKDSVKMEWQMLPRLAALAENQWTNPDRKNFDEFLTHLPHMLDLYQLMGFHFKDDVYDVSVYSETIPGTDDVLVTLKTFGDAPIFYTLDGTAPNENSKRYTAPFRVAKFTSIHAVAVHTHRQPVATVIN